MWELSWLLLGVWHKGTNRTSLPLHREEGEKFHHRVPQGRGLSCVGAVQVPFPGPVATGAAQNAEPAASCSLDQSLVPGSCVHHEKVLSHLSPGSGSGAFGWRGSVDLAESSCLDINAKGVFL